MSLDQILLIPGIDVAGPEFWQVNTKGWPSLPANLKYTRLILQPRGTVQLRSSAENSGTPSIQTDEMVHPATVAFNKPWNGYTYWMLTTPYPAGNEGQENPSILACNDLATNNWVTPNGIQNPVHRRLTGTTVQGDVYWSYDPDRDRLVMCYIRTQTSGTVVQTLISEFDGYTATTPTVILSGTKVSSPCLIHYTVGGVKKWRLVYNVNTNPSFPDTLHWKEVNDADLLNASAWAAATTNNVTKNLPLSRGPWDFQCWRLQSGEWLLFSTLTNLFQYSNHFGYSTDDLATVTWYKRPVWVPAIATGWPAGTGADALAYTSSLVVDGNGTSKAIITGKGRSTGVDVWGQSVCPLLEHPWRALASFPRDANLDNNSIPQPIAHGQKLITFTKSGAGSLDSDAARGLILNAPIKLSSTLDGLSSVPYTAVVEFRVPTAPSSLPAAPTKTFNEVCNVGGIVMGLHRWDSNTDKYLIEFRRADTNAAFWQPLFFTPSNSTSWLRIAFCRDGSRFYCAFNVENLTGTNGLSTLAHTQTNDFNIGSTSNQYIIEVRQIEVFQDAGFETANHESMEMLVSDQSWPQSDLVTKKPQIWKHPSNVSAGSGTTFECYVGSYPGAALQWITSTDQGSSSSEIVGATSNIYARNTTGESGRWIACRATNSVGTVQSNWAVIL